VRDVLKNLIIFNKAPLFSTLKTLNNWAIFVASEKFEVNFGLTVEEKGVIWDN
jgi:hypothetical protein